VPGGIRQSPPFRRLVVELVGPAAAGKTSLIAALGAGQPGLRAGLRVPRHRHLATALAHAPTILALHQPYDGLRWNAMNRMTYMRSLHRLLLEPAAARAGTVILDEGAVYMLARLQVHGADRIRSGAYQSWWHGAIEDWTRTLDLIVWLDAPDPVLRERLRGRGQPHPAKHLPDEAVSSFMARYRDAYWRVITALTAVRGPGVLAVRTDEESVSDIAGRIVTTMRTMGGVAP
jgi:hypothetical protein